jgi:DNA-binding NtrC family response regulator
MFVQSSPGRIDRKETQPMERNNKSVLVVNGDHDIRNMLSLRLISIGYRVYVAANGWEALDQMEKHSIDVVLTDYHMPEMNGFGLLSLCRVKWPGTPVVFISGEQDDMAHEAVERGAFAWVRKGSEFTMLLELLDQAIQQSAHA